MAFPVAGAGTTPPIYPTGSTANAFSLNGYIPEIWSGKMIEKFYDSTVLSAISNTDYEGEIKNYGDKVRIRTKPTITIRDYRADGALTVERPEGGVIDLLIDKGKYFNTILDDVMRIQIRPQRAQHVERRRRRADEDQDRHRRALGHLRPGGRRQPGRRGGQDFSRYQSRCHRLPRSPWCRVHRPPARWRSSI